MTVGFFTDEFGSHAFCSRRTAGCVPTAGYTWVGSMMRGGRCWAACRSFNGANDRVSNGPDASESARWLEKWMESEGGEKGEAS